MSSFLSQGKMIPLSLIPAVLELELGERSKQLGDLKTEAGS